MLRESYKGSLIRAQIATYCPDFDTALEILSSIRTTPSQHTGIVVAGEDTYRRCANCKIIHAVKKLERIRPTCPYCNCPEMAWVSETGRVSRDYPKTTSVPMPPASSYHSGQYTRLDFAIDFLTWAKTLTPSLPTILGLYTQGFSIRKTAKQTGLDKMAICRLLGRARQIYNASIVPFPTIIEGVKKT